MTYKPPTCSFCGKAHHEVRVIIAGPSVYICDECIALAAEIVAEKSIASDDRGEHAALAAALPYLERLGEEPAPPPLRSCEPKNERVVRLVMDRMLAIRERSPAPAKAEVVTIPGAPEKA